MRGPVLRLRGERMISRRGLITGMASLVAAPAIVRVASIMPVKAYTLPPSRLMANLRGGFGYFESSSLPLHAFYRAELVEEFRRKYSLLQRRAFASIS